MFKIYGYIENSRSQTNPFTGRVYYSFKLGFRSKVNKSKVNPNGYSYCWFPSEVGVFSPSTEERRDITEYRNDYVELTFESRLENKRLNGEWYELKSIKYLSEKPKDSANRLSLRGTVKSLTTVENGNNPEYRFIFESETGDSLSCVFFEKDSEKLNWNIKEGQSYVMQFMPICLPVYDNKGIAKVEGSAKVYRPYINYIVMSYRTIRNTEKQTPKVEIDLEDEDSDYPFSNQNLLNAVKNTEVIETTSELKDDPEIEELHNEWFNKHKPTIKQIAKQPEIGNWTTMTKEESEQLIKEFENEIDEPKDEIKEESTEEQEQPKDEIKEESTQEQEQINFVEDSEDNTSERAEFPVEDSFKDIAEDMYRDGIKEGLNMANKNSEDFTITIDNFERLIKLADSCKRDDVAKAVLNKLKKLVIK